MRAIDGICGECTGCLMMVKLQKCSQKFVVKIEVEDDDGEVHIITMFSNTLDKVALSTNPRSAPVAYDR